MTPHNSPTEELDDLVDGYLSDALDADQMRRLEQLLLSDRSARRYFTLCCRTHTDLLFEVRARRATDRALGTLKEARSDVKWTRPAAIFGAGRRKIWAPGIAAAVLAAVCVGLTWYAAKRTGNPANAPESVAWLANAQDCQWASDGGPTSAISPGYVLRLRQGLAELHFRSGATVVLQGPANLQLLSANSARLLSGRLSARVPQQARGFQVFAPRGKVVDLGTEFGLSVASDGSADVVVFQGKVEAYGRNGRATPLTGDRSARILADGIVVNPAGRPATPERFARQIPSASAPVARSRDLDFRHPRPGSLMDAAGLGTGFDARLPGTGSVLGERDTNLRLDPTAGLIELTTTRSDINKQFRLDQGEYLGTRLSDLGFTGKEDFEVTAVIPNIPSLAAVGQFGLYAGTRSDKVIRGGLISKSEPGYVQFLVNNNGGRDSDALFVGLFPTGSDVRLSLRRIAGKYSMSVENLASGSASTLSIRPPAFLDDQKDLYVGFFAANTGSEERRTMTLKNFRATIWVPAY